MLSPSSRLYEIINEEDNIDMVDYPKLFEAEAENLYVYLEGLVDHGVDAFLMKNTYHNGIGKISIELVRQNTRFDIDMTVGDKNIMKITTMARQMIDHTLNL